MAAAAISTLPYLTCRVICGECQVAFLRLEPQGRSLHSRTMADPMVKEMRSVDAVTLSSVTDVPVVDSRLESGGLTTTHTSLHDPTTGDGFKLSEVPHSPIDPRLESASTFHRDPKTKENSGGPIYVEFEENDHRNPMNMSHARKWIVTFAACGATGVSAAAGGTIASGFPSMMRDLNCSRELAAAAFSLYCLGFGAAPLVTASFSEEFGRQPLYIVSGIVFATMHLMTALAKNISTVIVARLISGLAGSTGATMVGGTVADIWAPHERGLPMAVFAVVAVGSTGLAPVFAGWVQQNPHLEWRWIQWIHLILSGAYVLVIVTLMKETRGGVILTREAKKLRKRTGDNRYRARVEDEISSLRDLVLVSCTRPIYLLFTEPVVTSFSLWVGFAWGVLYSQLESISLVFKALHNFSDGEVGLAFLPMFLGAVLGFVSNFYQERLYTNNVKRIGAEARLYSAMLAAVLFPIGCFIYAWTALPGVHWIGPMVGIFVFTFSVYIIYLAVFLYLADTYFIYASSALAGQSLSRNLMGAVFPLFTNQMYSRLTFRWASTIFGCLAAALALVPFILFSYGPRIRAKSRFARRLAKQQ